MKSRIFSRLVLLAAVAIAAAAIISSGTRFSYLPTQPPAARAPLPPSLASYVGVYEPGSPPGYQPVAEFAQAACPPGKPPNLAGYYSGWAEPFQTSFAEQAHAHGAIPYVQIDPTQASVPAIARGVYDIYLRTYADSVRDYGHAVVIGFGHEMNTSRYSWGYGHVRPQVFVAAWRHIVTLFHSEGADNVTWLWTINQEVPGTGNISDWWPGPSLRHLGRHRRLLLPSLRYLRQGLRQHHHPGADLLRQAHPAVRDRGRAGRRRPVRQDQQPVRRDAPVQDARAGVVRHSPERRHPPPGLAHRGQPPARSAFRLGVSTLTLARPSQ